MYCKHFALTAFPFDLTPEPDALFASSSLAEAEARIEQFETGAGKLTAARAEVSERKSLWISRQIQHTNSLLIGDPTDAKNLAEVRALYEAILTKAPNNKTALAGVELVETLRRVLSAEETSESIGLSSKAFKSLTSGVGLGATDVEVILDAIRRHDLRLRRERALVAVALNPNSGAIREEGREALNKVMEESRFLSLPEPQIQKIQNGLDVISLLDGIEDAIRNLKFTEARQKLEALPEMLAAAEADASAANRVYSELASLEHSHVVNMLESAERALESSFPEGVAEASAIYDNVLDIDQGNATAKPGAALVAMLIKTRECGIDNDVVCAWTALAEAKAIANESVFSSAVTGPADQWLTNRTRTEVYRTLARTVDQLRLQEFSDAAFVTSRQQLNDTSEIAHLSDDDELKTATRALSQALDHLQTAETASRNADFEAAAQGSGQAKKVLESQPGMSTTLADAYADHLRRKQSRHFRAMQADVERTIQSAITALTNQPLKEESLIQADVASASVVEQTRQLSAAGFETSRIDAFSSIVKALTEISEQVSKRQFPAALDALDNIPLATDVSPDITAIVSSARTDVLKRQHSAVEALVSQAIAVLREAPLDAESQTLAQSSFEEVASIDTQRIDLAAQGVHVVAILVEAGRILGASTDENGIGRARAILEPARNQMSTQVGAFAAAPDILTLAMLELDARQQQELEAAISTTLEALSAVTLDVSTLDATLQTLKKIRDLERQIDRSGADSFGNVGTNVVRHLKRALIGIDNLYFAGAEKFILAAEEQIMSLKGRAKETEAIQLAIAQLREQLEQKRPHRRDYMRRLSEGATTVIRSPSDPMALDEASSKIRYVLEAQQADLPMALALSAAVDEVKLANQAKQECRIEDALKNLQNASTHFSKAGTPTHWIENVANEITAACGDRP